MWLWGEEGNFHPLAPHDRCPVVAYPCELPATRKARRKVTQYGRREWRGLSGWARNLQRSGRVILHEGNLGFLGRRRHHMRKQLALGSILLLGGAVLSGCGASSHLAAHRVSGAKPSGPSSKNRVPASAVKSSPPPSAQGSRAGHASVDAATGYEGYVNRTWGFSLQVPQRFKESPRPEDRGGRS